MWRKPALAPALALVAFLLVTAPAAHATAPRIHDDRARADALWDQETRTHAAPVLRMTSEPGYTLAFYYLTTVPEITLYRNGLLVLAATPANGRWARLRIAALPESALATIGRRLAAIGIDHDLSRAENDVMFGRTRVVDVPSTYLEISDLDGISTRVGISAPPGSPPFDDPLTAAQAGARAAIDQLVADLQAPEGAFGAQLHPKQPAAYSADALPAAGASGQARVWPKSLPAPTLRNGNTRAHCATVRGKDVALLERVTRFKAFDRPWRLRGATVQIVLRPLFPAQASCHVHDGSA